MKLNHTLLSSFLSKKKILFGAMSLALIGGVAPALVTSTHAETLAVAAPNEEIYYTTVGPDYFTYVDLQLGDEATARIADTSIADFYVIQGERGRGVVDWPQQPISSGEVCYRQYACVQGKKIGTTEILIEKEGAETVHVPLVSVKLSPSSVNVGKAGTVINGSGTIEGADNNLLTLYLAGSYENIDKAEKIGDRDYTITLNALNPGYDEAWLVWKIGNQFVGGGTYYSSTFPVTVIDNVYHSADNEAKLESAFYSIYTAMRRIGSQADFLEGVAAEDGSFMAVDGFTGSISIASNDSPSYVVSLNETADELEEEGVDYLKSGFLNDTKYVNYGSKRINFDLCAEDLYVIGGAVEKSASNSDDPIFQYGDLKCIRLGEITKLGQPLDMAISVENVAGVKNGYTRKWYVTRDNNGVIERLDATYDEETGTIHFKSNGLGFYAYGYVDEKINNVPGVPNTGIAPQKIIATAAVTITPFIVIAFVSFTVREKNRKANKLAKKHNHFE